jgi:hypothetical protein
MGGVSNRKICSTLHPVWLRTDILDYYPYSKPLMCPMTHSNQDFGRYLDESISVSHHALRSARRRLVVVLLSYRLLTVLTTITTAENPSQIDDEISLSARRMAKEIVAIEEDISVEHATGETYHNTYNSLTQTHLPQLDNIGALKYNEDRKMVRPDTNLLALTAVATISSPVAQSLFQDAVADFQRSGGPSLRNSTND